MMLAARMAGLSGAYTTNSRGGGGGAGGFGIYQCSGPFCLLYQTICCLVGVPVYQNRCFCRLVWVPVYQNPYQLTETPVWYGCGIPEILAAIPNPPLEFVVILPKGCTLFMSHKERAFSSDGIRAECCSCGECITDVADGHRNRFNLLDVHWREDRTCGRLGRNKMTQTADGSSPWTQ